MPKRYTLTDLAALAGRLLTPLLGDPLPRRVSVFAPPAPAPAPCGPLAPAVTFEVVPVVAEFSASPAENSATEPPAEPLYVRRGAGKGARYDVAEPDATGERYRLRMRGRRKVYELAGVDR